MSHAMAKTPCQLAGAALGLAALLFAFVPSVRGQQPGGSTPSGKIATQTKQRVEEGTAGQSRPQASARPARSGPTGERRDPFRSLFVGEEEAVQEEALPPGKRGLVIAQVRLNGIVAKPTEMIAVVTMRGRNRAYFLHEGDDLYDGYVDEITVDAVIFKERAVDAFGREYEKEVVKQLSGSGAQ